MTLRKPGGSTDGPWVKVTSALAAERMQREAERNIKRMKLEDSLMKTTPIAATDGGKIFVVSIDGKTGRIMAHDEFLALPIESYDCWKEITEFDINQR